MYMYGPHYGKSGGQHPGKGGGRSDGHTGRSDRKPPGRTPEIAHVYPFRNWMEDLSVWCALIQLTEPQQGYAVFAELGGLANDKIREATRTQPNGMTFLGHSHEGQETVNPSRPGEFLNGVEIIFCILSATWGPDLETMSVS